MSSRAFRRYVAVGTLAALASLAGANPVQAREIGRVERAWQWVQEAWRFSGLNLWSRTPAQSSTTRRTTEKGGWGLDPNGKPAPDPDDAQYCASCDLGHGIDPNG
ncbi:MAG TPA: hypothetical protein VF789_13560 [Thermoanaerobaculia bacterium]